MHPTVLTFVLGLQATAALAADQWILGNQLLVKNPSTPQSRGLIGRAKEVASPNPLVGDPTAAGATLTVRADGDNPSTETFALPQGTNLYGNPFWSGNATSGFKYKDAKGEQGPISFVQIKKSASGVFQIKVKGNGKFAPLSIVPPNLGTGGCMLLTLGGGDSYSVAFPTGTITNKGPKLFKVKKPPVEGTCVIAPPTTTTSSSSTSTTESTTTTSSSSTSTTESTTTTSSSSTSTTESTTTTSSSSTSTTESTTTTSSSSTSTTESTTTTSTSSTSTSSSSTSTSTSSTSTSTTSTSTSTSSTSTSTSSSSTSTSSSSTSTSSTSTSSSTTSTSTSTTTSTTVGGPTSPPDVGGVGTITFGLAGGSPGDSGGATVTFTCVDTTWTKLYWGSSSTALPRSALDASLDSMSFSSFTSTVMTWDGTTTWTNPATGTTHTGVPTRMTATITAGGLSWVSPPSEIPSGIGAAVKVVDPAGTCSSFAVKVEFFADIPTDAPTGFIPLNTILNAGGSTMSSFTGAFYWVAG